MLRLYSESKITLFDYHAAIDPKNKKCLGFVLDIREAPQVSSLPENRVQVAVFNMLPDQHEVFSTSITQFCLLSF
jgi:hypothetical protein